MSETPPPVSYPRNVPTFGSSSDLQSLFQGYNGLTVAFVVNVLMVIPLNVLARTGAITLGMVGLGALVVFVVVFLLTLGPNKKIGEGAHWQSWQPILGSFLIALNSAVCCGIVGYVVMQTIAANHIKKFGFKRVNKKEIQARIAELQAQGTEASKLAGAKREQAPALPKGGLTP